MSRALHPGTMVTRAQVQPHLPGTAAGADLVMQFSGKNTFIPPSAQSGQLRGGCLDSLTASGCAGDVELPTLPMGDQQEREGSRFALGIPSPVPSCDTFSCLMPLCRDAAQGFVPPNYLLFNFCFLLKVLTVPGKMSS